MYITLALLSSLVLGAADFVGGSAAKRASATVVVVWSHAAGLVVAVLAVGLVIPGTFSSADLAWGAAAGLSGSIGAVLLYRALACGLMSLVAPTSAAAAAAVPVAAGLASGERLSGLAAVGVVAALVSVVLLTRVASPRRARGTSTQYWTPQRIGPRRTARGMAYAVMAGISFGVFLVLLAETAPASGLWPLVGARGASLTLLVGVALLRRESLQLPSAAARPALLAGLLDMTSNMLVLVAVRGGDLAVVGLLASLSPLGTVALARLVLRERLRAVQGLGALLAMGSVMLLAVA